MDDRVPPLHAKPASHNVSGSVEELGSLSTPEQERQGCYLGPSVGSWWEEAEVAWSAEVSVRESRDDPNFVIASIMASSRTADAVTGLDQNDKQPGPRSAAEELANGLIEVIERVVFAAGFDRLDLAYLIGCAEPDPLAWRNADEQVLRRSIDIVKLMNEQIEVSNGRSTRDAIDFLHTRLAPDTPELTISEDEQAHHAIIECRAAARETVLITLEVLSRLRSDVDLATEVLAPEVPDAISIAGLIKEGRTGAARKLAIERIHALRPRSAFRIVDAQEVQRRFGEEVIARAAASAEREAHVREPFDSSTHKATTREEVRLLVESLRPAEQ